MNAIRRFGAAVREFLWARIHYIILTFFITLFAAVLFYPRFIVTVNPGEAGVLYKRFGGGTVVDHVYREGLHFLWPWNRMYVYNVRTQALEHTFETLSSNGLPMQVEITIRYLPYYDLVGVLHQRVGPDYVNIIVLPEVKGTIREAFGQHTDEEIYRTQRGVVQKLVSESLTQTGERYVRIDDVLIKRIILPQKVQAAIEEKMTQKHRALAYEYILQREEKEADRKRIEAAGIRDFQQIIGSTLTEDILRAKGIAATQEIAQSPNAKVVVIGSGKDGLPIILGGQ
jgi:regulator of protease activity HflC (stomatin/prohibitin superfamily)